MLPAEAVVPGSTVNRRSPEVALYWTFGQCTARSLLVKPSSGLHYSGTTSMDERRTDGRRRGTSFFFTNPAAWLAAIVDSSDDAIVGKTLDSVIRSWNTGATRIFQYQPAEIIGHSVLELIPPELQHEEKAIVDRLSRGERIEHFETVRLRRDGTRIDVSLSVSPIRDKSGHIVGAAKIARDMTEQKRLREAERELTNQLQELAAELEQQLEQSQSLQQELEESNETLVRSLSDTQQQQTKTEQARRDADQANDAKSRFLATMSHELRTPLNAIAGYVDLLDAGVRGTVTEEQRGDLIRIKRNQESLLRLIDNVLDLAKLEAGRLQFDYENVRLDELLGTLETFIAPRVGQKRLTYSVDACDTNLAVRIDRAKVEQILLNLLSNAVKFTDHGEIRVMCRVEDNHVRIQVRDTGHGIRADLLSEVFEPFVRGDESLTRTTQGTGLGLSISRQLARAMAGEITVESTVGAGSTFTLLLPRERVPDQPQA
jgi:PAS domain S-box-containing protein